MHKLQGFLNLYSRMDNLAQQLSGTTFWINQNLVQGSIHFHKNSGYLIRLARRLLRPSPDQCRFRAGLDLVEGEGGEVFLGVGDYC